MSRSIHTINPQADVITSNFALQMNIGAAKGLMNVLKTNLGPRGTLKMLVSGAGDVKLTKDGCVLLGQMQIQHPTASLIARTATAQDDITGDGTTSSVLFTGELLRQAERYVTEGLHPRALVEGFEIAREKTLAFLREFAVPLDVDETSGAIDREILCNIARTSLRTKLHAALADHMTEIVVDAILTIAKPGKPIDLHMVEIMHMEHQSDLDTKLVKGLVLDHGARHPDMPKRSENCYILTANISLEYEKTEVNSGFFYSNAEEREMMVRAERKHCDEKVMKIIELKESVCTDPKDSFILVNQKGIDPISLDMLQKAGIVGIRRAKRRNMERLSLACGGYAINSVHDMEEASLGRAGLVYEHVLGENKYTFIEDVENPFSCTVLIKGPNKHTIAQIKDALRDGLRAVKNAMDDRCIIPGAGAFEAAAYTHLQQLQKEVKGRSKLGVRAFADALLVIPKTLVTNSGHDQQDTIIKLLEEVASGNRVGLDLSNGEVLLPDESGIWDNYRVKRQIIHLATVMATKLLLVDEVLRAGRQMSKE